MEVQPKYKQLTIYAKAKDLVLLVYETTGDYPKTETYSLVPQMRRSALSVVANIVEGYSKDSSKEYQRFLTMSIGSITELEVFVDLSLDLKFVTKNQHKKLSDLILENKKLLYSTRKSIRLRIQ